MRRICIRMVRFWRSIWLVQIRFFSGFAHDWDLLRTDDFGGRVPALAVLGLAVHLDVHCVVARSESVW
jgi:hypothetical protein